MALQQVTLEAAAATLRVHPRTICRAITGQHNTYWYEDCNHDVYSISVIAEAYHINNGTLIRCIEGRDSFLKPSEAAVLLGIKPRTFRERLHRSNNPRHEYGRAYSGGIVRYLKSKIIQAKIARSPE